MTNAILKAWKDADKETRTDFVIIFCQNYYALICQTLKDLSKCHQLRERHKEGN